MIADRNEFSEPESAPAEALMPNVARATTRVSEIHRVFPGMRVDIDHPEWFL